MRTWIAIIILFVIELVQAQYYFGQNKIQPFDYDWAVFQTTHFDIYYYSAEEALARVAGNIAEQTHARFTMHFRYAPTERIPIVLYSAPGLFSETHTIPYIIPEGVGGFTEFIKGRVVLPYDGSLQHFRHILAHELVHIWQLHYGEFLHDAHELFFIDMPPLWFTEGQAELLSQTRETPDERTEIIAAIANDRFVLPQYFYYIRGTYQMYKEGQSFLRFLNGKYGEETDVRLFERVWEHGYFSEIFHATMGISLEDAGLLWRQWLMRRFGEYISRRTPQRIAGKRLSPEGLFFSPVQLDSNTVLCKGNRMGYAGIYILRNGKAKMLRKIEMTETAEATKLVANRIGIIGDSLIAFSAKARGKDRLFVMNLKSRKTKKYEFDSIIAINSPTFDRYGERIFFSGTKITGEINIWSFARDTEILEQITEDHYYHSDPVASPVSDDVIFVSDMSDTLGMHLFRSRGDILEALAWGAPVFRPGSPDISDDGRWLTFVADDDTFPDVYIYDLLADTLWRATKISEPVFDVHFVGGDSRLKENPIYECTLLVSISDENGAAIKRIIIDSMEYIGVFEKRAISDGNWNMPLGVSSLSAQEKRAKPNAHRLTFDIAQGEITTASAQETGGGLEMMLSDMMGDHRLYIFFLETAQNWGDILKDANIVVAYDRQGVRWNWTAGVFHLHLYSYNRYEGSYDEMQAGFLGAAGYSLSRFTRIEGTGYLYYSERNDWSRRRYDAIVAANLSLIRDTALWGPTGPLDGMRANLTIGTSGGYSGKLYRYIVSADIRHYLRLSRRNCWAHRAILRHSEGDEPQRFYMGGTWDFRGYPYFYFFGKNQALFNSELRFPLLDRMAIRTPLLNFDLNGIRGAMFFDAGDAWEDEPEFVGSYGIGARMNIENYIVLRFDLAQTTDFKTIDPHWRWDIFFGWDF